MFGSQIIDVAIGMIFVYLLFSLLCSAANEIIEMALKKRAKHLEDGLIELLHDKRLVEKVYNHPLVNGLFDGAYKAGSRKLPSYIPATNFALALMDLVPSLSAKSGAAATVSPKSGALNATASPTSVPPPSPTVINVSSASGTVTYSPTLPQPPPSNPLDDLRTGIQSLPLPFKEVRDALTALVDAAGNDAAKARQNIEDWYNATMDRVSGWYKRRAQVFILIIGFVAAVALNVDSITILKALSTDKALRDSVAAAAETYAKANAAASPTPAKSATETGTNVPEPTVSSASRANTTPSPAKPSAAASPSPLSASPSPSAIATASTSPSKATAAAKASPTPACDTPECKYEKSLADIKSLSLPIGWLDSTDDLHRKWPGNHWRALGGWWWQICWHWLGWLITALALSLGAPFWFDMLNKFIVVRSTVKPKEKSQDEPSKS